MGPVLTPTPDMYRAGTRNPGPPHLWKTWILLQGEQQNCAGPLLIFFSLLPFLFVLSFILSPPLPLSKPLCPFLSVLFCPSSPSPSLPLIIQSSAPISGMLTTNCQSFILIRSASSYFTPLFFSLPPSRPFF
uniref:Uncharacterized protein n=1 Tax=Esox lucius TaxID=8010 RepID=A0A6Q2XTU1_ESOLU